MAKLKIELTENDIREAVKDWIERRYEMVLAPGDSTLTIEVKSAQNYKSEWENAHYRGRFEK